MAKDTCWTAKQCCKKFCLLELLSQQTEICNELNNLDSYVEKSKFLASCISNNPIAQRRPVSLNKKRRDMTTTYFVRGIPVCRQAFRTIFGISHRRVAVVREDKESEFFRNKINGRPPGAKNRCRKILTDNSISCFKMRKDGEAQGENVVAESEQVFVFEKKKKRKDRETNEDNVTVEEDTVVCKKKKRKDEETLGENLVAESELVIEDEVSSVPDKKKKKKHSKCEMELIHNVAENDVVDVFEKKKKRKNRETNVTVEEDTVVCKKEKQKHWKSFTDGREENNLLDGSLAAFCDVREKNKKRHVLKESALDHNLNASEENTVDFEKIVKKKKKKKRNGLQSEIELMNNLLVGEDDVVEVFGNKKKKEQKDQESNEENPEDDTVVCTKKKNKKQKDQENNEENPEDDTVTCTKKKKKKKKQKDQESNEENMEDDTVTCTEKKKKKKKQKDQESNEENMEDDTVVCTKKKLKHLESLTAVSEEETAVDFKNIFKKKKKKRREDSKSEIEVMTNLLVGEDDVVEDLGNKQQKKNRKDRETNEDNVTVEEDTVLCKKKKRKHLESFTDGREENLLDGSLGVFCDREKKKNRDVLKESAFDQNLNVSEENTVGFEKVVEKKKKKRRDSLHSGIELMNNLLVGEDDVVKFFEKKKKKKDQESNEENPEDKLVCKKKKRKHLENLTAVSEEETIISCENIFKKKQKKRLDGSQSGIELMNNLPVGKDDVVEDFGNKKKKKRKERETNEDNVTVEEDTVLCKKKKRKHLKSFTDGKEENNLHDGGVGVFCDVVREKKKNRDVLKESAFDQNLNGSEGVGFEIFFKKKKKKPRDGLQSEIELTNNLLVGEDDAVEDFREKKENNEEKDDKKKKRKHLENLTAISEEETVGDFENIFKKKRLKDCEFGENIVYQRESTEKSGIREIKLDDNKTDTTLLKKKKKKKIRDSLVIF